MSAERENEKGSSRMPFRFFIACLAEANEFRPEAFHHASYVRGGISDKKRIQKS